MRRNTHNLYLNIIISFKRGVYQDYTNKESILELLRYKSTGWEKLTSEDYKQRANSEQKIYYIVGDNEKY